MTEDMAVSSQLDHAVLPPETASPSLPSRTDRVALRLLQSGAIAVVLAAVPYKLFDLDRFFVPKELALAVVGTLIAALCIARARTLSLTRSDELLAAAIGLTIVSGIFATNVWLAERSVAIALGGAACFWCARYLARAGFERALIATLAFAGALGAITSLMQAYGVETELFSLNRAPGGTFGNRNFMAHLCAITLPAMFFSGIRAKSRTTLLLWSGALAAVGGALMMSRTRAAWLALIAGLFVLLVAGFIALRKRDDSLRVRRIWVLIVGMIAGPLLSLVIPNSLDWRSDSPYLDTATGLVNYKKGSGHGRLIQYGNTLAMSVRHPVLGVGPGNWAVTYPKFASDNDPSLTQDGMTANPWPSSDWVTFVSERGIPAAALLCASLLVMMAAALRGLFAENGSEARFGCAVFLATLASLMIVGLFDAVLLLPAPALIGWGLLGALSPASRVRRVVNIGGAQRVVAVILVLLLGTAAATRSATQIGAMSLFNSTTRLATLKWGIVTRSREFPHSCSRRRPSPATRGLQEGTPARFCSAEAVPAFADGQATCGSVQVNLLQRGVAQKQNASRTIARRSVFGCE